MTSTSSTVDLIRKTLEDSLSTTLQAAFSPSAENTLLLSLTDLTTIQRENVTALGSSTPTHDMNSKHSGHVS